VGPTLHPGARAQRLRACQLSASAAPVLVACKRRGRKTPAPRHQPPRSLFAHWRRARCERGTAGHGSGATSRLQRAKRGVEEVRAERTSKTTSLTCSRGRTRGCYKRITSARHPPITKFASAGIRQSHKSVLLASANHWRARALPQSATA